MANYKITLNNGTEQSYENIVALDVTDRNITGINAERDIEFVYPVASVLSLVKI